MGKLSYTDTNFLSGVPFDNSYAHTRWFDTKTQQYQYFKAKEKFTYTNHNFVKIVGKNYIDLNKNVEDVMDCNYLMFKNNEYSGKWFYAFIINVASLNSRTTRVYYEIDVMQTWQFEVSFKKSWIVREHESLSNNWNIVPESFNMGNEYEIVKQYDVKPQPFYYLVYCIKERFDLDYDEADEDGNFYTAPDSLSYYVIPIAYPNSNGEIPDIKYGLSDTPLGQFQTMNHETVSSVMYEFRQSTATPKNIVSVYLTDYLPIPVEEVGSSEYRLKGLARAIIRTQPTVLSIFRITDETAYNYVGEHNVGNVFSDINEAEPKLRYYPYTVIELSDGRGNVVNYKPEGLRYSNGQMVLKTLGAKSFHNYVAYGMRDYNRTGIGLTTNADIISNGIINSNPQDIAVLDELTTAYLQGAKNSLEAQRQTWQTDLFYNRVGSTLRGASSAANLGVNAYLGSVTGGAHSAGGLMSGGLTGGGVVDDVGNMAQAFTNYMHAGADYQNKVNEQNAMLEDIGNQPPNLVKQGSNTNSAVGNDLLGVRVTIKRVRPFYLEKLRNYFHVFGYKSNAFKVPNIKTRTHFNYIQTTMANVQCAFYNEDIAKVKAILDNGITLWHTDDIYNYDVTNGVR